jgi:hypothetical protein
MANLSSSCYCGLLRDLVIVRPCGVSEGSLLSPLRALVLRVRSERSDEWLNGYFIHFPLPIKLELAN